MDGREVSCGVCSELVYPNALVVRNHDVTILPDGRARWFSRDFGVVVHECETASAATSDWAAIDCRAPSGQH